MSSIVFLFTTHYYKTKSVNLPHTRGQRLCLLLLISCLSGPVFAQTVAIEYDYLNPDNAWWRYETGNDTTYHQERKIRISKEIQVKVRLRNFNADALQSELIIRKGPSLDSIITTSITSLLGMVANFAVPAGLELTKLLAPKSRGEIAAPLRYVPLQVDLEQARLLQSATVADLDGTIRERLSEITKWRNVREQLKALRYDSTLPKADLQRRCQEALVELTAAAPALFDNESQARQLLGQLAVENAHYLKYVLTLLEQKANNSNTLPVSRGEIVPVTFNDFLIFEAIKQHRKLINDDLSDQLTTLLYETLAHYRAVTRNTFTASLSTTVDRNSEAIVLQFYDNSPSTGSDKRKVVRSDKFTIAQPAQWQIVTSFGISFIQFSQRIQSYGVVGGKVAAADLDQLTPTLAGYVQVFPRTSGYVRLGGHIGVGVPLTDSRGVCFQFGPSVAFGRQNAISINAGLFTARANRLGAGLSVGDSYTTSAIPPTVNRYEWGYNLGISFQFGLRR